MSTDRVYVSVQCDSTKLSPDGVPYRWHHTVDAERAEALKKELEERWPDVTVTIERHAC